MIEEHPLSFESPAVVMTCGLPASGKTTAAMRLHAHLGGVLIRSCDVYRELGIVLSEWVTQTRGFTICVSEYDRLRDEAYGRMAMRADAHLAGGARIVILDAVHGEMEKRGAIYAVCQVRGATPVLVLCRCDDLAEIQQRFRARRGREAEPEHEASDLSVFHDIHRRWQSPMRDLLPNAGGPTVVTYDTLRGSVDAVHVAAPLLAERIRTALAAGAAGVSRPGQD